MRKRKLMKARIPPPPFGKAIPATVAIPSCGNAMSVRLLVRPSVYDDKSKVCRNAHSRPSPVRNNIVTLCHLINLK